MNFIIGFICCLIGCVLCGEYTDEEGTGLIERVRLLSLYFLPGVIFIITGILFIVFELFCS